MGEKGVVFMVLLVDCLKALSICAIFTPSLYNGFAQPLPVVSQDFSIFVNSKYKLENVSDLQF